MFLNLTIQDHEPAVKSVKSLGSPGQLPQKSKPLLTKIAYVQLPNDDMAITPARREYQCTKITGCRHW
jgi:hypothetical protein